MYVEKDFEEKKKKILEEIGEKLDILKTHQLIYWIDIKDWVMEILEENEIRRE
tara:strand:+ start:271 stop:429 length:159 start_codon:yes stop_codon:yes gene_type:complete